MVASIPNDIFQFSTWAATQKGFSTGQPRVSDLTTHGTDGIGLFSSGALMILVDSRAYTISERGTTTLAPLQDQLCFAMVTIFQPLRIVKSERETTMTFKDLEKLLSSTKALPGVGGGNSILPFKIKGTFTTMSLVMDNTSECRETQNEKGTMFGYIIPTWMEAISGPRLHCHFVGEGDCEELNLGGRVKNFEAAIDAAISVGKCGRFHLGFPQGQDWEAVVMD